MNRRAAIVLALASLTSGAVAHAASLQKVSNWSGGATLPSYVSMYIYVPDKPAAKPPIVVAAHYCTGTASAYFGAVSSIVSAANTNGFIMIFPEATGRNCWDVGSTKSLTHDGGGDTHAIAQMVRYTLTEHDADASRVYVVGSSSGAMMTQALLGVYPDLFKAGVEFSGVPCGCWAVGYDTGGTPQWSNDCAGGKVTKSAQAWGDQVRAMFPGYTGPRPRIQMWHGTADTTINYNNFTESLKQWSNLLGLPETPTLTETPKTNYERKVWKNACGFAVIDAWSIKNGTHGIPFEGASALAFFGLDKAGPDPEAAACGGDAGAGGTGGGSGGTTGSGGAGGGGAGGAGGADGGSDARDATGDGSNPGTGGTAGSGDGGGPGTGGRTGTGGAGGSTTGGSGGAGGSGGSNASGGSVASGGSGGSGGSASGGSNASGGSVASGGTSSTGGAGQGGSAGSGGTTTNGTGASGCSCTLGGGTRAGDVGAAALLLATFAFALGRRRRRG